MAKSIGVLSKARKILGKETLLTLYFALIYPYIMYCNVIWGNADKSVLWPIYKLQKQAIRLINNLKRYESTQSSFKAMKLLRLPDVYKLSATIFMCNLANKRLPTLFNNFLTTTSDIHRHSTRQSANYRSPRYKTKLGSRSIKKTGVDLWNSFTSIHSGNCSTNVCKGIVTTELISKY